MPKKRANGEGSLRKRSDGRWEGRYTAGHDPETGKAIYKNVLAKTQKECKEKLAAALEQAGKVDTYKTDQYTVGQWAEAWFENYRGLHAMLRQCLDQAVQERLIPYNPAAGCKLPPKEKKEMHTLPAEKISAYLAAAEEHGVFPMFYLELTTGLRRGELVALLWDDLDLETQTLTISKSAGRINGEVKVTQPKTANSVRTIYLPQETINLLLQEHAKHSSNPIMFPSPVTGKLYGPDCIGRLHKNLLKKAGIAENIPFHGLRHTFATLAIQQGIDAHGPGSLKPRKRTRECHIKRLALPQNFLVWVLFGSKRKHVKSKQTNSGEKQAKSPDSAKNQEICGRSAGIRTRGLLDPKIRLKTQRTLSGAFGAVCYGYSCFPGLSHSNASIRSRCGLGLRLGQTAIALVCPSCALLLTGTWGPMCAGGTRPSHDRANRRNSAATNKQAGRYISSHCLPCLQLCVSFPVPSGSYLVTPLEIPLPLCYTGVKLFWRR